MNSAGFNNKWCCSLTTCLQNTLSFGMCLIATYETQTGLWLVLPKHTVCVCKNVCLTLTGKLSALR